ncbi:hypothetical protein ACQFN5_29615 (plasmid) [Klebsiella sp. WOUb02]|uniref:hypothetical protein n=1 Tax=Klebsiella sp. WOUb02 TaxID=3161071 RepID=UPI003CEFAD32
MERPVFGSRWAASLLAAKTGQQVRKTQGAEAYLRYHHALFAGGLTEGRLTDAAVEKASGKLQFTPAGIGDINATLTDINDMATATGFTGTPGIIIMPVRGASTENTTVFAGMAEAGPLQAAIDKARQP